MATESNHHDLDGLKQDILLQSVSLRWNQGIGRAPLPLEDLMENPSLCLFQLLELHSLAHGPFLQPQSQQHCIFKSLPASVVTWPSLLSLPLL